jgi:hypothetical protein
MHRESNSGLDFTQYSNVRIERPIHENIQEVRLRYQLMDEAFSEEVTQLEETAC